MTPHFTSPVTLFFYSAFLCFFQSCNLVGNWLSVVLADGTCNEALLPSQLEPTRLPRAFLEGRETRESMEIRFPARHHLCGSLRTKWDGVGHWEGQQSCPEIFPTPRAHLRFPGRGWGAGALQPSLGFSPLTSLLKNVNFIIS